MSERLAIKTDHVEDWQKGKVRAAVKDLTPRLKDNGLKSSWAHCAEEGDLPGVLDDPGRATCRLQALALFIFSERFSRANRNKVSGLSLFREAISPDLVIDDQNDHPVRAYSKTHRSLLMSDEQRREETAVRIVGDKAFQNWEYSRYEMAELLRYLLDAGYIDESMEQDARSLLLQWSS